MQPILLASSSSYRRDLLKKIGLHFECASPDIDESPLPNENAGALVERLAIEKAKALATQYPDHLIIGSDQIAVLSDVILGKPHSYERAFAQLRAASGQQVIFKTGVCLLNTQNNSIQSSIEEFTVNFKILSDEQIHHYLNYEQPYDCAGSFKCEGLGIALFTQLSGDDPNTLIGLPLIRLIEMLNNEGIDPLLLSSKKLFT
jgi:MAF protein